MRLKKSIILIYLCCSLGLYAQEKTRSVFDSIFQAPMTKDSTYIKNYHNRLNINFNISNDYNSYVLPFEGNDIRVKPNISLRYGMDFNYKFATIKIGFRPTIRGAEKEEKGESDYFRLRVQFIFKNWAHRWSYNQIKGYYISNTDQIIDNNVDNKVQFPGLTSYQFYGQSYRKLNPKYSIQAIESQTEAQKKSAGTWMPSIDYWYYFVDGMDYLQTPEGEIIYPDQYSSINGFNIMTSWGYHYTFVYKKFYTNLFTSIGMGYDYSYTKEYTPGQASTGSKAHSFTYGNNSGLNLGYNSNTFYLGASVNNRIINYNANSNRKELSNDITFSVFIGHRFKPPKTVSKTIDVLEEKVPILNH